MKERRFLQLAFVFLLGIFFELGNQTAAICSLLLFVSYLEWEKLRKREFFGIVLWMMLFAACFGLSAFRTHSQIQVREHSMEKLDEDTEVFIRGEIYKKEYKNESYYFYFKNCQMTVSKQTAPVHPLLVRFGEDDYSIGETLLLYGQIYRFSSASNMGQFDQQKYYQSLNIDFWMKEPKVISCDRQANVLKEWLYGFREIFAENLTKLLGESDGGVLSAMLVGEKSSLDSEVKMEYQKTGISHILAISGLHVSLLGMGLYRRLRKLRLGFWKAGVYSGIFLASYVFLTGFGASAIRAAGMLGILWLGEALGRSYDTLNSLGAMAILLLWQNPFFVGNSGFLFSFLAILGVCAAPVLFPAAKEDKRKKLKDTLSVSISVWLFTAPLIAYSYYELPMYSVLINLLVLPLVPLELISGLAAGFVSFLSMPFAGMIAVPCRLILNWYHWLCVVSEKLPGSSYPVGQPQTWKLAVYASMLLLWLFICARKQKQHASEFLTIRDNMLFIRTRKRERNLPSVLAVFSLVFLLCLKLPASWEVTTLDVGQGDGIYIRTGDGTHVFIDGGSSSVSSVGTYRILPFLKAKGVSEISYWFVSHLDKDHINGLYEVLESGYPVTYLVFSEQMPREENFHQLAAIAEENRTRILFLDSGDRVSTDAADFICLSPAKVDTDWDANDRSLVLLYSEGEFQGFFGGDISAGVEKRILQAEELLKSEVDFYKAAHHGSKYSNSLLFLQELSPKIAVVSCGLKNFYGHPADEAVSNMEQAGAAVFYTMTQGQVTVTGVKDGLKVTVYHDK